MQSTIDFAKNVKKLIDINERKLFHMVCDGFTSREEVLREILRLTGLDADININLVNSSFFSKEYFAERPACERLINRRLNEAGLNIMRDWKVALAEYLESEYASVFVKNS